MMGLSRIKGRNHNNASTPAAASAALPGPPTDAATSLPAKASKATPASAEITVTMIPATNQPERSSHSLRTRKRSAVMA
jgi:hypothetical protein